MAVVQRTHADRVAGDQIAAMRAVPQCEGVDAIEQATAALGQEGGATFTVERIDDFAIGVGLEGIRLGESGLQFAMIVDLAIDRQGQRAIGRSQWLGAAGRIDDRQPLMGQHRAVIGMHAAPVRAAMALQG